MSQRGVWAMVAWGALGGGLLGSSLAGCGSSGSPSPPHDDAGPDGAMLDAPGSDTSVVGTDATVDGAAVDASVADVDAGEPTDAGTASDAANDDEVPPEHADAGVGFTVDVTAGPGRQFQPPAHPAIISPYIYGINAIDSTGHSSGFTQRKTKWGLIRNGGNMTTAWNWTINYRNEGNIACYAQGPAGGGSALAGAVTADVDSIPAAQAEGAAFLATVPIVDHVAAAVVNDTSATCPASSSCTGTAVSNTLVNSNNFDFVSTDPASTAFVANAPKKGGAFCTCAPGSACDAGCVVSTNPVYQDEFVNLVRGAYGGSGVAPVFFSLDNEPNYWGFTHPEVFPFTGTVPCQQSPVTYDDIVSRDELYGAAVKAAWPATKVFGPVVSQDGMIYAHSYASDVHAPTEFLDYYLGQMASASATAGVPLLDALDVHYYASGSSDPAQCVQNPRTFWDPGYTEISPTALDNVDLGWSGLNNYFDTNWYPRVMIPRLLGKVATAYASGGPGLSFSEYNSGCETTIAGGVAEADDLGVFGREGVFAAAAMPLAATANNYLLAAFDLYRNYDGNGAMVGDTAVGAATTSVGTTSVYAFAHSTDASKLEVVAVNKATTAATASIVVAHAPALTTVAAYQIVAGAASVVAVAGGAPPVTCSAGSCSLQYVMPAMSATTLVLR